MNVIAGWGQLRTLIQMSPRGGPEKKGKDSGRISNQYLIVEHGKLIRGPRPIFLPLPIPKAKKGFKMQDCGVTSASGASGNIVRGL